MRLILFDLYKIVSQKLTNFSKRYPSILYFTTSLIVSFKRYVFFNHILAKPRQRIFFKIDKTLF